MSPLFSGGNYNLVACSLNAKEIYHFRLKRAISSPRTMMRCWKTTLRNLNKVRALVMAAFHGFIPSVLIVGDSIVQNSQNKETWGPPLPSPDRLTISWLQTSRILVMPLLNARSLLKIMMFEVYKRNLMPQNLKAILITTSNYQEEWLTKIF